MRVRLAAALLFGAAALGAGCSGAARPYAPAETIALAAAAQLNLPLHESYRHWLLRTEQGWCGAHDARFGGDDGDPAVATVRAAVFRDADAAARAFARLTPAYLYRTLEPRMIGTPWPVAYPETLPGEQVMVAAYDVVLPPEIAAEVHIVGQYTGVRAGRVVLLVESIGIRPQQFVPAIQQLTDAAAALPPSGC